MSNNVAASVNQHFRTSKQADKQEMQATNSTKCDILHTLCVCKLQMLLRSLYLSLPTQHYYYYYY